MFLGRSKICSRILGVCLMKKKCITVYSEHFEIRRIDANHLKCFTCNKIWNNDDFENEYRKSIWQKN